MNADSDIFSVEKQKPPPFFLNNTINIAETIVEKIICILNNIFVCILLFRELVSGPKLDMSDN